MRYVQKFKFENTHEEEPADYPYSKRSFTSDDFEYSSKIVKYFHDSLEYIGITVEGSGNKGFWNGYEEDCESRTNNAISIGIITNIESVLKITGGDFVDIDDLVEMKSKSAEYYPKICECIFERMKEKKDKKFSIEGFMRLMTDYPMNNESDELCSLENFIPPNCGKWKKLTF